MDLHTIQKKQEEFIRERKWENFNATQVFSHLIEELGEVVRHFLYEEKYKIKGAGHQGVDRDNLSTEIAQSFSLFLQLCIHANVDLEEAWKSEFQKMVTRFNPELWRSLID